MILGCRHDGRQHERTDRRRHHSRNQDAPLTMLPASGGGLADFSVRRVHLNRTAGRHCRSSCKDGVEFRSARNGLCCRHDCRFGGCSAVRIVDERKSVAAEATDDTQRWSAAGARAPAWRTARARSPTVHQLPQGQRDAWLATRCAADRTSRRGESNRSAIGRKSPQPGAVILVGSSPRRQHGRSVGAASVSCRDIVRAASPSPRAGFRLSAGPDARALLVSSRSPLRIPAT
jgi:hypothetical protein